LTDPAHVPCLQDADANMAANMADEAGEGAKIEEMADEDK